MYSAPNLAYTRILVNDLARAEAFYRTVLKLKRVFEYEAPDGWEIALVGEGKALFQLFRRKDQSDPIRLGNTQIGFEVDSLDEVNEIYDAAILAGANPVLAPHDFAEGMRVAIFADPDGHQIELLRWPGPPAVD